MDRAAECKLHSGSAQDQYRAPDLQLVEDRGGARLGCIQDVKDAPRTHPTVLHRCRRQPIKSMAPAGSPNLNANIAPE